MACEAAVSSQVLMESSSFPSENVPPSFSRSRMTRSYPALV